MPTKTEVLDMLSSDLPEPIVGVWSLTDADDIFGDLMSHWFAINDVAYAVLGDHFHGTYRPGVFGPDCEDYPACEYLALTESGDITPDMFDVANRVFERAYDVCKREGWDY